MKRFLTLAQLALFLATAATACAPADGAPVKTPDDQRDGLMEKHEESVEKASGNPVDDSAEIPSNEPGDTTQDVVDPDNGPPQP